MARTMLTSSGLNFEFWGEAVKTAIYLRNRSPNSTLHFDTPYFRHHGQHPSLGHLRVFGSAAVVYILGPRSHKFQERRKDCIFVGYSPSRKSWRFWDNDSKSFIYSRDATFIEHLSASSTSITSEHLEDTDNSSSITLAPISSTPALTPLETAEETGAVVYDENVNSESDDDNSTIVVLREPPAGRSGRVSRRPTHFADEYDNDKLYGGHHNDDVK